MLTQLDHIAIVASDLKAVCDNYEALFGRRPISLDTDRARHATFHLGNVALELISSADSNRSATELAPHSQGIFALAFATTDLTRSRHVLERRGIRVEQTVDSRGRQILSLATEATHGPTILVVETDATAPPSPSKSAASISGLDHVVITTDQPERAAAFYGARLGLEMKLDRTNPDWGSRLLFFKCGDLIVEIAHSLKSASIASDDKLWGLSWRVADIAAAHSRIAHAGFNISEVRAGRKPGTHVFTVRDRTAGVPTLIIGRN